MANQTIARADLLIVPRFDRLGASIRKGLDGAGASASKAGAGLGRSTGAGFGRGLAASGALIGAFSAVTARAMSSVSDHVGAAVSRFDTLNNYPRTMVQLGYSAQEAEASISLMSDRLQTMPTRLDDMASTVKGIVAVTGDLGKATRVGLALNDMLVASGSSTQLTTAAMEQFRQILAKGKPEMEDWKSLTSAMPGQMAQLAKAMLGPTATASDLYTALGGGGSDPTVTMDQLMDAIVTLDEQGGDGMTSFRDQAETAAGGVSTAMDNLSNSVTRGLAGTLEAVGSSSIAGVAADVKGAITQAFSVINSSVSAAMPALKAVYGAVRDLAPTVAVAAGAFAAMKGAVSAVSAVTGAVGKATEAVALFRGGAGTLTESLGAVGIALNPVTLALGAVAAVAAVGITSFEDWSRKQEDMRAATDGLTEAVSDTSALKGYQSTVERVGAASTTSAMSVDELAESTKGHVERMRENAEQARAQIAQLDSAQATVMSYVGKTDLSTEAQGRLQFALKTLNDQLGTSITAQDVQNGQYTDADGRVRSLTESLGELIARKREEARVNALSANLEEAYTVKGDADAAYARALNEYEKKVSGYERMGRTRSQAEEAAKSWGSDGEWQALQGAREQLDAANESVESLSRGLGELQQATSGTADALDAWAADGSIAWFPSLLEENGQSIDALKEDMRSLGVSTADLGKLTEADLTRIARDYDGTSGSIVSALQEAGVAMTSVEERAQALSGALSGMGEGVSSALSSAGVDAGEFSRSLAEAGVSTEELNAVGSENIAALAASCQGDIGLMTFLIQHYNDTPLLDKDGRAQVDDAELVDAEGNVWRWNGTGIVDKDGMALMDDTELVDAQGNLWTWNGSNLQVKTGSGTVYDFMSGAIKQRDEWNRDGLRSWTASGVVNIFQNVARRVSAVIAENAAGGIRPHADGGIRPRYHAGGAIATRAVPLDVVGEDGAEAIVPLTNRRYSQPFADIIAERFGERSDPATREIASLVRTLHADLAAILGAMPEGVAWRDFVRMTHRAVAANA